MVTQLMLTCHLGYYNKTTIGGIFMTIELRPMGVACNLGCTYCYQEPIREAGNINTKYDIDKMLEQVERIGQDFSVFGGEALLLPKIDLERLWKYGYDRFGKNSIQTNGTLIDDDHIELMKKYNVNAGVSIDGWEDLNDLRVVRGRESSIEKTRESTKTIVDNIIKLRNNDISVGIIITLHKKNGVGEKLDSLIRFIRFLGDNGIKGGNIHTLEVDSTMKDQEINVLSERENIDAFLKLAKFFDENHDLSWNPFKDMADVVRGDDAHAICTWKACDVLNTQAVYGIEGDGALSNCGRTNKEGVEWYKADKHAYLRYISLYDTPQEMGGCKDCRFWMACGGSCVGEGFDGDVRNKTMHCGTQKALLGHYEDKLSSQGVEPITLSSKRIMIEKIMLDGFVRGNQMTMSLAQSILRNTSSKEIQLPVKDSKCCSTSSDIKECKCK
jgi:uncharacterized protein